jgi:hypothetical protein
MREIVYSAWRRAGAWTLVVAPVGALAIVLMPLARDGEGIQTVRRLIEFYREQRRARSDAVNSRSDGTIPFRAKSAKK